MCNARKSPDKIAECSSVNKEEDVATSAVAIIVPKTVLQGETRDVYYSLKLRPDNVC
jgi:hypothetical protein